MQFVLESVQVQVLPIPPGIGGLAEGAVSIIFTEHQSGITMPITIPRLQAYKLGSEILACSKMGSDNGAILPQRAGVHGEPLPPIEPVYGPGDHEHDADDTELDPYADKP